MRIECKNIKKNFGKQEVIKGISYTFEENRIYGIYGRNGTGKSVFLKMLCGFYTPSSGEIYYDGQNLNDQNTFPSDLRALIDGPSFFPDLSGFENLKMLARIQNKISDTEIERSLEIVNLIDDKNKKYGKYSLGMKQKLGIAQAIMEDPSVIVLDEPFNGIERESVNKILKYLKKKKEEGKIVIISSHIKEDLENLSDVILFFDDGQITERKSMTNLNGGE